MSRIPSTYDKLVGNVDEDANGCFLSLHVGWLSIMRWRRLGRSTIWHDIRRKFSSVQEQEHQQERCRECGLVLEKWIDSCEIRTHAGCPNNLAGYRLNHSAKLSSTICADNSKNTLPRSTWYIKQTIYTTYCTFFSQDMLFSYPRELNRHVIQYHGSNGTQA